MPDSNPEPEVTKIDEGWDEEPAAEAKAPEIPAAPRPPPPTPPAANLWGPVPSGLESRRPPPAVVVAKVAPKAEFPAPIEKPKVGLNPKEARAAKAAKKAAKKAARQAERKERARNNNRAAVRAAAAAAAAKVREFDVVPASATPRAGATKSANRSTLESRHRADVAQPAGKGSRTAAVRPKGGGVGALSTTMLLLVAAVLVLAGLGWFLASRR